MKSGATVRTEDLAGLRNLARLLGDRFVAGYVMYTGQQTLSFGDRIKAIPVDALWLLAPLRCFRSLRRRGGSPVMSRECIATVRCAPPAAGAFTGVALATRRSFCQ